MPGRDHIVDEGAECPAFIAKATFESEPKENIHTPRIEGRGSPNGPIETDDIVIRMVVGEDGGLIEYESRIAIYQRVFNDVERATTVFRDTVDSAVEDLNRVEVEFEFDYDARIEPVEFNTRV